MGRRRRLHGADESPGCGSIGQGGAGGGGSGFIPAVGRKGSASFPGNVNANSNGRVVITQG